MTRSDEELIVATGRGDREAFAEIYRRRRPDVYRFAAHMTGDPSAAEDVTQDVFMAVIRDARHYDPRRAAVVGWLLGIARNHARRSLAKHRAQDPLTVPAINNLTVCSDPVSGLARERQIATLRKALRALPLAYREAVVLCDLQELTYADAAAALGCGLGTLRSRLHRGRAMLGSLVRGEQRSFARWPAQDWIL
jgi:RNA polymerase sigma-70 factor (ECF subfamily)